MSAAIANRRPNGNQFTLRALFEYTTLCCLLAALASVTGVPAALSLMGFGLALLLRQGCLAVFLLAASFVDPTSAGSDIAFLRELAIASFAGAFCVWLIFRRGDLTHSPGAADLSSYGLVNS